jgi:LysM repeat protein
MPRGVLVACALCLSLLGLAGCGLRDESPPPTATPDPPNMLQIVTPTPGTPPPPEADRAESDTYVVQAGDSLFDIAVRFGISMEALQDANGIEDPNNIFVGQELTIPGPGEEP